MKKRRMHQLLLVLLILMVNVNFINGQYHKKLEEGFVQLFNGENFDGWHLKLKKGDSIMAKEVYAIEDGMVHVFKDMLDSLNLNTVENATHGLFYTNKKYSTYLGLNINGERKSPIILMNGSMMRAAITMSSMIKCGLRVWNIRFDITILPKETIQAIFGVLV